MFQKLKQFIPLAIAITGICGLIHLAVQQNYRSAANDPQIQASEDISSELASGRDPVSLKFQGKIDISKTLSPFIMIFDKNGKVIASNGQLNGQNPQVPDGVLVSAKQNKESRITWQPATDVRIATVVSYFESSKSAGFVLVGRSLKEVEKREEQLQNIVLIGWLVTLAISLGASVFLTSSSIKTKKK